jgi:hypothetical protein
MDTPMGTPCGEGAGRLAQAGPVRSSRRRRRSRTTRARGIWNAVVDALATRRPGSRRCRGSRTPVAERQKRSPSLT